MLVAAVLLAPALFEVAADSRTPVGEGGELPFPAPVFGLVAFGLLMFLLLVTFAFRNVGKRH